MRRKPSQHQMKGRALYWYLIGRLTAGVNKQVTLIHTLTQPLSFDQVQAEFLRVTEMWS